MNTKQRRFVEKFLAPAGVQLNGPNPWDPQIKDERVFDRILSGGSLSLGESYMDGDWDVDDMAEFFARIFKSDSDGFVARRNLLWPIIKANVFNVQNIRGSKRVAHEHYDLGNDLYEAFLDSSLSYTCGYWKDATDLDGAQKAKHRLICEKLGLTKDMRILDIGCGWGWFAAFAAEEYGVEVVGVTISEQQKTYAEALMRTKGISGRVEIRLQDYRNVTDGPYDRIVSIGMFEHVGPKNYRTYMRAVRKLLDARGLFLLQTVAASRTWSAPNPWFDKYIFRGGYAPSVAQIGAAIDSVFVMKDWHAFGQYYERTMLAWHLKFDAAWPQLEKKYGSLYDGRFYRMWRYYLLSVAGGFRADRLDLWQIVLSPKGVIGGYPSIR